MEEVSPPTLFLSCCTYSMSLTVSAVTIFEYCSSWNSLIFYLSLSFLYMYISWHPIPVLTVLWMPVNRKRKQRCKTEAQKEIITLTAEYTKLQILGLLDSNYFNEL